MFSTSTLIFAPAANHIYQFKTNYPNHPFVTACIVGLNARNLLYYDFSTLTGAINTQESISHKVHPFNGHSMVPEDALPFYVYDQPRSPLIFHNAVNGNVLKGVDELCVNINNYRMQFRTLQTFTVRVINHTLASECRTELDQIKVVVCNFPIFAETTYPRFSVLKKIFNRFVKYNSEEKLAWQTAQSEGRCALRAHFINILLNHYRIPSAKIYKLWHKKDWAVHKKQLDWGYHCAALLFDDQNQKWVWDPWVTSAQALVPLKEWVYRADEPKPAGIGIANRSFIFFTSPNNMPAGPNVSKTISRENFNAFQATCIDAVPNPPERPLLISAEPTLFRKRVPKRKVAANAKALIEYEDKIEAHKHQKVRRSQVSPYRKW